MEKIDIKKKKKWETLALKGIIILKDKDQQSGFKNVTPLYTVYFLSYKNNDTDKLRIK